MRPAYCSSAIILAFVLFAGCSGTVKSTSSAGTVPLVIIIRDVPPSGVTVTSLSFDITGISTQPTTPGMSSIPLLTAPIALQMQNLLTQNEFLTNASLSPGVFNNLMLTFGTTASMTIFNKTTQPISVGATSCAVGQICQVEPAFNTSAFTFGTTPFPLTLTTGTPVVLAIDFNLRNSLQSDLSISPFITLVASSTPVSGNTLVEVTGVNGVISALGNGQFTLLDSNTRNSLSIAVNSGTLFNDFSACAAGNFTCLQIGQNVSVPFGITRATPAVFSATSVGLNGTFTQGLDGVITGLNPSANQFSMVLNGESPLLNGAIIPGVSIGQLITVTPAATASFRLAANGTAVPPSLVFQGLNDLVVGQHVFVNAASIGSGMPPAITADQVVLTNTQFSGVIASITSPNLTVGTLNSLFTNAGTSQIFVETSQQTQFANLSSGFSSLSVGSLVNFGGLLFSSPSGPVLIAQQVALPLSTPVVITNGTATAP